MENQKFTTVDLSQFRNTEIGKGYQARGVIRQRNHHSNETTSTTTKVVNMMEAQKKDGLNNESSHRQQPQPSSSNDGNRTNQTVTKQEMNNTPSEYLACKGIREFRKEIEKILNQ